MTPTTPPAVSEAMREAVAREYVLVKRGLYYRPQAMGYTGVLDDAGRYPEAEAMGHVDHASGVTAILASEAPRFSDACWPETITKTLEADLAKAASEIARLTGERDALAALGMNDALIRFRRLEARAEAAEADLTRMRAETERFRAERDELIGALEDTRAAADDLVPVCLVEGDNRAAGALQFVSGFISDRIAALSNPEQTNGR